jgi:oligoribonuclease
MTGLDTENDTIMSLAAFVTDADMNLLDEDGYEAVIHHTKEQLDRMGEWCTSHHGQSGLTQNCLDSTTTAEQAAEGLLAYIKRYVPERRTGLLAGNSVHADKSFLVKQPYQIVTNYLHYRILDVSTIKEAARRWAPKEVLKKIPRKQMLHEARADILESIEEARFYRETFFMGTG